MLRYIGMDLVTRANRFFLSVLLRSIGMDLLARPNNFFLLRYIGLYLATRPNLVVTLHDLLWRNLIFVLNPWRIDKVEYLDNLQGKWIEPFDLVTTNDMQPLPSSEMAIFTWRMRNVLKRIEKSLRFLFFWDMVDFVLKIPSEFLGT